MPTTATTATTTMTQTTTTTQAATNADHLANGSINNASQKAEKEPRPKCQYHPGTRGRGQVRTPKLMSLPLTLILISA